MRINAVNVQISFQCNCGKDEIAQGQCMTSGNELPP